MSLQTATCFSRSRRGSRLAGGREGHLRVMVTRLSGRILSKGPTSSGITAMKCKRFVPHEMELEPLPPKTAHTTQPKQQGRSTEKPTRIESIRNIPTCPLTLHIGKLWKKHISHPRKGCGVTVSKWFFPEPSRCIGRAHPVLPSAAPQPAQGSRSIRAVSAFHLRLGTVPSLPPSAKESGHRGSMVPASPGYHQCRLRWQRVG